MRFNTLDAWLDWQSTLHAPGIDLGLERVQAVQARLALDLRDRRVLTVAGTNGKGSAAAMLDAILQAAGYRTGRYTSPHLTRYNERVTIAGRHASDVELLEAFEAVDRARQDTPLTYFEFGTLAALWLFAAARLDVVILEVGLGGRLDAVNAVDSDACLITRIGLDHQALLGDTREAIGREKAGIFRAARPAVCADPDPPASIAATARAVEAKLYQRGRDFELVDSELTLRLRGLDGVLRDYARPALFGGHQLDNAAGALVMLEALRQRVPVAREAIDTGLAGIHLPGRFEVRSHGCQTWIFDVAHNPQAAHALARQLAAWRAQHASPAPVVTAIFGCLRDKDARGIVQALAGQVDGWITVSTPPPRGIAGAALAPIVQASPAPLLGHAETMEQARAVVQGAALRNHAVLVVGSFLTVGAARDMLAATA